MASELRPGERVRLTARARESMYRPGDRGIVLSGDRASDDGWLSYFVRMEGQPIGSWTRFAAHELERDSELEATRFACHWAEIET